VDKIEKNVVAVFPPKQAYEGGAVSLQFQAREGDTFQVTMKPQIARYLGSQLQLYLLLLPKSEIEHMPHDEYSEVVDVIPPDKSPDGETVSLKFQTANDEMVRIRMPASVAQQFGTQLLLLPATSGNR